MQFEANGYITSPDPFEGIELYVPGSDQSSNDPNVTSTLHYNNILGIFNILETPVIEYQHSTEWITDPNDPFQGDREFYAGTSFKLQNEIKYVVNPASGLNQIPVDIKAAFLFKDMFDINLNNSSALERVEYEDGTFVYQTPFIPLSCINDYIVNLDYNNTPEFLAYDFIVELKIMVSLELDEATAPFYSDETDNVLFMSTYSTDSTDSISSTISNPSYISNIPTVRFLDNTTFNQDETIYAWGSVILGENIETNGNEITIIAGGEITGDLTNLPENINLIIGSPSECEGTVLPQTGQDVYNFCNPNDDKYNPVVSFSETPISLSEIENDLNNLIINVYPNPFFEKLKIEYTLIEDDDVNLTLQNSLGQIIENKTLTQQAGNQLEMIDGSTLPNGMYYLTIKTTDSIKTIKVSKQNR